MPAQKPFDQFTNLYSLSKTLRFELKPIGKTLDTMRENLRYDGSLQTFFADKEIEDAYQTLKPIFDKIHEQFITESLESETAQKIDFSEYLEKYHNKDKLNFKILQNSEKVLREAFEKIYAKTAENLRTQTGKNKKNKDIFIEKGYKILTEKGILEYIKRNIDLFSEIKSKEEIEKALKSFEGFFTYFNGFNQNRENYYETKKEAATAVATRIVHNNLPKFCDNIIFFENRSEEYLNAYSLLREMGRELVNKEGKPLTPITQNIFTARQFTRCLSQGQIELYNEQIGNANSLINLYNQARKDESGFKILPFFKILYKQIGCGRRKSMFFILTHDKKVEAEKARKDGKDAFSMEEILEYVSKAGEKYLKRKSNKEIINSVPEILDYLQNRKDFFGIYWSKTAINTISNKYFANWHELKDKFKTAKIFEKAGKGSEDDVKIPDVVELEGLFHVLNETGNWKESVFKESIVNDEKKKKIINNSETPSKALLSLLFEDIKYHYECFLANSDEVLRLEKYDAHAAKEKIKSWLDHALTVCQMLKYFQVKENKTKGEPLDSIVSHALDTILRSDDAKWFIWYDSIRNYLTKKPQDDVKKNKLKLNFENSTLAKGWDINKEPDNYCVILQNSKRKQFLAIIVKQKNQKGFNKIFEKTLNNLLYKIEDEEIWQKVEYKLLPGPNKMLPKCLLPKSNRKKYGATDDILSLYDRGSFKKNESNFSMQDLNKLIDFYKSAINKYEEWQCFNFSYKPINEYKDISEFYSDVEKQGYRLDFVDINKSQIDKWVEEGKIYLFEIKNQDTNERKKLDHRNNLHTLYWKAIFENIKNRPKLNGEAELFYRKALSSEKLKKRRDRNGKEIIENFRFSKEKFFFHVPITLNFCLKDANINEMVNKNFSNNKNAYFLGIDRGEKHLAYYSLIDKEGKIKEQGTLNMPFVDKDGGQRIIKAEKKILDNDGKEHTQVVECRNYNDLLDARAGGRNYARKNWQTIGTIKELKEGYISQVVKKITDLAVINNAFIVLEDLNTGFKRGRQKIEKSVYQKFELALAKKLNFLVDKSAKNGEIGSVTKALQLTPPVNDYGDIENRKQLGIILYTRANYTSQTDPVTGWRKKIYLKKGSEDNIREQILNQFIDIRFDGKDYYFVYSDNNGRTWKIYSGKDGKSLERFRGRRGDKNEWTIEQIDILKILDQVFSKFNKNESIRSQIENGNIELEKTKEKPGDTAWESLRFAIDLIQQIRNTGIEEKDKDFILSPVRDENDNHFDSRLAFAELPNSGDANGAYNIARKGIVMREHIKRGYKLFISDAEWDAWLAGKEIWEKWLANNY